MLSGGGDGKIKLWDLERKKYIFEKQIGSYSINTIQEINQRIFTGDTKYEIKIWDLKSGSIIEILKGHNDSLT